MSKSNKDESHIPPDASAIVEYFLNTTEQHTKHGFLDVLMTVD